MSEYFVMAMLLSIVVLVALLWVQYKLLKITNQIAEKLTSSDEEITRGLTSIDNIEYAITGTSQNQKDSQDYIRNKFSSNGNLRSDKTSLRDFLEHQKYENQEIKIIGVELKWLRKLWEYKNISSTTRVEDRQFRDLVLTYRYEWLIARGVAGEELDNAMKEYYKLDEMFDKKI
jgi:hypothetical protein